MILGIAARQQPTERFVTRLPLGDQNQERRLCRRIQILDPDIARNDRFDPSSGRRFIKLNQPEEVIEIAGCNGRHSASPGGVD